MLRQRTRRAAVAIEFSMTLTSLIGVALTVGQLGLYLSEGQRFVQATFEATRFASMAPGSPTEADVRAHAETVLANMGMSTTDLELSAVWAMDGDEEIVTVSMALPVTVLTSPVTLPATYTQEFTAVVTGGTP